MIRNYVIHVKGDNERFNHIQSELEKSNIDAEYILDGNISDLTDEILDKYTIGVLHAKKSVTSCTIKHIYAYEKMLESNSDYALIFEDDVILSADFNEVFNNSIKEFEGKSNFLVSYENSIHTFLNNSEKVKGQYLYKKEKGRCAGVYLVDKVAAKNILEYLDTYKNSKVIDIFHNLLAKKNLLNIYWCEPTIAVQASHNGQMKSLLDNKKYGFVRKITYQIRGFWKNIISKIK